MFMDGQRLNYTVMRCASRQVHAERFLHEMTKAFGINVVRRPDLQVSRLQRFWMCAHAKPPYLAVVRPLELVLCKMHRTLNPQHGNA